MGPILDVDGLRLKIADSEVDKEQLFIFHQAEIGTKEIKLSYKMYLCNNNKRDNILIFFNNR